MFTMRILWQLRQTEEPEHASVVVQELSQLIVGVLGLVELQLTPGTHHLPLLLVLVTWSSLHWCQVNTLGCQVRPGEGVAVSQSQLATIDVEVGADVEVSPVPVLPVSPLEKFEVKSHLYTPYIE